MLNKRFLLFLVMCTGVAVHAGGIFWLHNLPVPFQQHAFENVVSKHDEALKILHMHKRTELLAEVFEHVGKKETKVKEKLHELKAEYAPSLDVAFPVSFSLDLSSSDFSFESSGIQLPPVEEPELLLSDGSSLISALPLISLIETPSLSAMGFEDENYDDFGVIAGSDHFDIRVDYGPKRSRPGYVFKVTFLPRTDVPFKRIHQNFYFLIDRSNSIPRARYTLNKEAVANALNFLKPGDHFNILIFDDHVVRFSNEAVELSDEAVTKAREFLDKQSHGGYFAATELYASLDKIIPQNVAEDEINTAILLSDGDTYLSQEKQRLTIGGWTTRNEGKVGLYTVASGVGNNLPLLDLLSSFNKGALIYAQEHQDVSERLAYLMRTIQNPIGKQIIPTAVTEDKSMTVLLQPKVKRIPELYQNRPFVIYGSTNRLSDFVLFVQGRHYDKRFDIKKKIAFSEAKMGSYSIERGWTQLLVQEFYEHYFEEGNISYLETAKQLLAPLNLPVPLLE